MKPVEWKTYRTRFLVKAKQLSSTLSFTDHLGRQHCGRKGDYLVESSDGVISIAPRQIFEDIYVLMSQADHSSIGETRVDAKKMNEMRANASNSTEPNLDRMRFESLEIEHIAIRKSPISRQRTEGRPPILNDEAVRARRKFPQPVRERATPSHLRLM
jgi:hypothetical protein